MVSKKSNASATSAPDISIDQIVEASENTRRTSWGNLDELAASIAEQGQITPGLVRPIGPGRFELVVGARRFRAAKLANLALFRTEIRELDDETAHEMRMAENNQREDVSPLEEAEAFRTSRAVHGRSVEEIASRLGRSPAYVYQRLRLLELASEVRELVAIGRLGVDAALLVAQFEQDAQREIVRSMSWGDRNRRLSKGDVTRAIEGSSRRLSLASFDVNDAELVPAAGACTTCPRRTGTQGTLFGVLEDDRCLNTPCFDDKGKTNTLIKLRLAKEAGAQVIEGEAAAKVVDRHGLRHDAPFVRLDDAAHYRRADGTITDEPVEYSSGSDVDNGDEDEEEIDNTPVTWREVLGDAFKPIVAAVADKVLELAPADIAHQALAAVDPQRGKQLQREAAQHSKINGSNADAEEKYKDEARKAREKALIEREGKRRAMAALVASVEAPGDSAEERADLLRAFVVAMMQGTWADTLSEVCARRAWELKDRTSGVRLQAAEVITREMSDFTTAQVSALAVEIVATRTSGQGFGAQRTGFEALCEVRNIDMAHHKREASKAAKDKKKAKGGKGGAKKSKGKKAAFAATADELDGEGEDVDDAAE